MSADAEAIARREAIAKLKARGWRPVGDVPYTIAHRLAKTQAALKGGSLEPRMRQMIRTVLDEQGADFEAENYRAFDVRQIFLSPALVDLLVEHARLYHGRKKA